MSEPLLSLSPIGIIRTPFRDRYEAPRQPSMSEQGAVGRIILNRGENYEQALHDLDGFDKIWLIYWFDRNRSWKPKIQVPRGPRIKRGVFATRSPHRPNPIGLSLVDLISVRGLTVTVGNVDLLDRTPILDIKPYLPNIEAFPEARSGWVGDIVMHPYEITWASLAEEQRSWLLKKGVSFEASLEQVARYPIEEHPYRRIRRLAENRFELAVKSWRLDLEVHRQSITITCIRSGYFEDTVSAAPLGTLHDDAIHREFLQRWK